MEDIKQKNADPNNSEMMEVAGISVPAKMLAFIRDRKEKYDADLNSEKEKDKRAFLYYMIQESENALELKPSAEYDKHVSNYAVELLKHNGLEDICNGALSRDNRTGNVWAKNPNQNPNSRYNIKLPQNNK